MNYRHTKSFFKFVFAGLIWAVAGAIAATPVAYLVRKCNSPTVVIQQTDCSELEARIIQLEVDNYLLQQHLAHVDDSNIARRRKIEQLFPCNIDQIRSIFENDPYCPPTSK